MSGFGIGLSGYGLAQPEIREQDKTRQHQAALAQVFQALQKSKGANGMPTALPGGTSSAPPGSAPGGAPVMAPPANSMAPAMPWAAPAATGGAPAPAPAATGGGFGAGMPNLETMMSTIAGMPGDDATKMAALEQYGAFASPFEKMQQQLEMKQMQISSANDMLNERLKSMRDIAGMRDSTTRRGQDTRDSNQDATRDVGAIEKELGDQRSYLTGLLNSNPKAIDSEEYKTEKKVYDTLRTELENVRKGGKPAPSTQAAPASEAAAATSVPAPAEAKDLPDGTEVPDSDGNTWIKKGDQLVMKPKG